MIRSMLVSRAIDLYIGELARRGRARTTLATYERLLFDFHKTLRRDVMVVELILREIADALDEAVREEAA